MPGEGLEVEPVAEAEEDARPAVRHSSETGINISICEDLIVPFFLVFTMYYCHIFFAGSV